MHGKTSAARQDSADGHARHIEATPPAAPLVRGDPHTGQPSTAVRIPPFVASRDNSWARQWPLRSFLELGAFPGAVPCARLHARQILWEWRLTGLSDIVELLISELVTNAIQISRADAQTTPVRLWMLANRARVLILVWDSSPQPPVRMSTSQDDENGRGLLLVETLSTQWDWYFPPQQSGGKVVWALLQLGTDYGKSRARHELSQERGATRDEQSLIAKQRDVPAAGRLRAGTYPGERTRYGAAAQSAGVDARLWLPPDPEILRRVKAALTRL